MNQPKLFSVKSIGIIEDPNLMFREMMEDSHISIDRFGGQKNQGYWGVYDGHGGPEVAQCVKKILHQNLLQCLSQSSDVLKSLKDSYIKTSKQVLEYCNSKSGSTAVSALIMKNEKGERWIHVANVGDSRAVLCRNGKSERLSFDHNPSNEQETERIQRLGGKIKEGRINNLSVSRSFGDKDYVVFGITAEPYVSSTLISTSDTHLIIATDGLWDVVSDQEAVDFIKNELSDAQKLSEKLLNYALERGSQDNITIIVIIL